MSIIKEFKEFALRGNLIDMSIAFVMGGAFGALVNSFNTGLVMPIIGFLTAGIDFNSLVYVLTDAQLDAAGNEVRPEVLIRYGEFITVFINLMVISVFMFVIIKIMNKLRNRTEPQPTLHTGEEVLLQEILDELKKK